MAISLQIVGLGGSPIHEIAGLKDSAGDTLESALLHYELEYCTTDDAIIVYVDDTDIASLGTANNFIGNVFGSRYMMTIAEDIAW